ncbi:MAG: ethanolamine utilization protein EutJ [Burkholderiales bacterium]|nr:ethanolamine utilization protein EutJ [Burkholderiales bacterium]
MSRSALLGQPAAETDAIPQIEAFLVLAASRLRQAAEYREDGLRFGIDLGTATIVLTAVDDLGTPVYWNFIRASVVRDGVVVDFQGAVRAVAQLKRTAESALRHTIGEAATAHPPAVPLSDCRACAHVLQQAGIDCRKLVDEVSAANALLAVRDGAVIDVGGGSTGVGVFTNGELRSLSDRAGGGHHLDLILAGALRIPVEEAEVRKREQGAELLSVLRPGIERVAASIGLQCANVCPGMVHLAGGALQIPGADAVIERYLGWQVKSYLHADLITPFGIAVS